MKTAANSCRKTMIDRDMATLRPPRNANEEARNTSIPIVPRFEISIDRQERVRLEGLATRLLDAESALGASDAFGEMVGSGLTEKPRLLIGDQSEISLFGSAEEAYFGYRTAFLAGDGDMVVLAQERNPAFERYLESLLDLENLDFIEVGTALQRARTPLPMRCLSSPEAFRHIVQVARSSGGLDVVAHITTGYVWRLAQAIAEKAGVGVSVCGPPPRLSKRVNDKLWFAGRVREVLGRESLPPTFSAFGPAALAAHVKHLAKAHDRVVVKVPDSAGSAGNLALESASISGLSLSCLRARLTRLLGGLGWKDHYPLLVEVWDTDVMASPSVQVWIPSKSAGLPIVEGVFEQMIEGEEGDFVGAVRARLPDYLQIRLADEAARLALLFQQLGYFGRCSFDAVIVGREKPHIHWIECNGRWGGVSLPMTLVNRMVSHPRTPEILIVQQEAHGMRPIRFGQLLRRLGQLLYRPGENSSGVVLLTPAGFERGRNIHFMVLSETLEEARRMAAEVMKQLAMGSEARTAE